MRNFCLVLLGTLPLLAGCLPMTAHREVVPDYLVVYNDDSLRCKILTGGDIMTTRVLSTEGDTLELDNTTIDRIIHLRSGTDVTSQYIDRNAIKVELARRAAVRRRDRLKEDIEKGRVNRRELLRRAPVAILSADLEREKMGPPQLALSLLNLSDKTIAFFRVKVYCMDRRGNPVAGTRQSDNVFLATSRIAIEAGEDFTTTLYLRSHPRTQKAKVEIYYVEFTDKTRWIGLLDKDVD